MTDEELLVEAKQAGAITATWIVHFSMDELRAFARRIAEIEREECAQVCEMNAIRSMLLQSKEAHYQSAADIRARGEK